MTKIKIVLATLFSLPSRATSTCFAILGFLKENLVEVVILGLVFLTSALPVFGQTDLGQTDNETAIHFFWSPGCPYCLKEKAFLEELEKKYPQIEIKQYELSKNIELVREFYKNYEVPSREQGYVPITFTRDRYFVGFNEQINKEIEKCIQECLGGEIVPKAQKIKIPLLGEIDIDTEKFSIPVLAIIFGALDGFNICSLGTLVLILGLVLALKSKRKILIFGGVFVLTTAIVYGILVFLWHQLFVFIAPSIRKMEILIGLLALASAAYFLKEFLNIRKRGVVCQFGGISEKLAQKIQKIFERKTSILTLMGAIFLFAAIVTIIEFPCTTFFPVLFAGILANSALPFYLSLSYMGLYILFYMLDEIIVLLVAALTMKIWIASPKFSLILTLTASILLFLLGFYYLFGLL